MENKKLNFFKFLSIVNLGLTLAFCGFFLAMFDKSQNLFWLLTAFITFISNLINCFYAKWSIKIEKTIDNKKAISTTYIILALINLIPVANLFLIIIQTVRWIIDYISFLSENDRIDYNV